MLKRIAYLGYNIKNLDRKKFFKFVEFVVRENNIPKFKLYSDVFFSSIKYNISPIEYFLFHFYEHPEDIRKTFAGTGFMYEYQLRMNPIGKRKLLEDKLQFLRFYKDFILHDFISLSEIESDKKLADKILQNKSGKIVLKSSGGQCGWGIEVRKANEFNSDTLIERLKSTANDYVEEFVQQHADLNLLSPSGLNTIRIITQIEKNGTVTLIGTRLRITVDSVVDNMAAGNIAASINSATGVVDGPGVYSDITKDDEFIHPITGISIIGFQIPYWEETISLVKKAALLYPENRSIGWDVAITSNGPELIEGNHDWCKLLWQLPVKKGLKNVLVSYDDKQ